MLNAMKTITAKTKIGTRATMPSIVSDRPSATKTLVSFTEAGPPSKLTGEDNAALAVPLSKWSGGADGCATIVSWGCTYVKIKSLGGVIM